MKAPIGSQRHITQSLLHRATKRANKLATIRELPDAHTSFTLLHACMNAPQLNYHLRCAHPHHSAEAATTYENAIQESLRDLAGGTLPNETAKELMLHIKIDDATHPHFGVGITSAFHSRAAAYIASRAATHDLVAALTAPANTNLLTNIGQDPVKSAVHTLASQLDDDLRAPFDNFQSMVSHTTPLTQHELMRLVNRTRTRRISPSSPREEGCRRAQLLPGAKDWLRAAPSTALGTHTSQTGNSEHGSNSAVEDRYLTHLTNAHVFARSASKRWTVTATI